MSPSSFLFGEYMNDDLEAWLALQTKQVNRNVTIVTRGEHDGPLLHISPDNGIKNFIPRLPEMRTDRDVVSVPRVCVSRDLASAIMAHGHMPFNFAVENIAKYYIYAFDWDKVLEPTDTIAGIPPEGTGSELWLVNYNKDHVYIRGKIVGELHLVSLLTFPQTGFYSSGYVLNCVVKTKEDIDFYLKDQLQIAKGQAYEFKFAPRTAKYNNYDKDSMLLTPISSGEYSKAIASANKPKSVLKVQM